MKRQKSFFYGIIILIGIVIYFLLGSVLPRFEQSVFLSPDETAVALFAKTFQETGAMKIVQELPVELASIPGWHPRSMVQQGEWLVPVGFLGMPFLIAIIEHIVPGLSRFFTLFLILSSAYPLWMLIRKKGGSVWVSATAAITYLFFPSVLLYVNRGFFPNLPVLGFTLWGLYLFDTVLRSEKQHWKTIFSSILFGLCFGFAFAIRPIEALWILPWIFWIACEGISLKKISTNIRRFFGSSFFKKIVPGIIAGGVVLCTVGQVAVKTYPYHDSWFKQPVFGYELKDVSIERTLEVNASTASSVSQKQPSLYLPFGFHPRQMLTNIRLYLVQYLAIWFWPAVLGVILLFLRFTSQRARWGFVLSTWTVGILLLFYGQSGYTDNINGSVALGNSFLRYLLPIVPLMGIAIGYFIETIARWKYMGKALALFFVVLMACAGIWVGFQKDEEGILSAMKSLQEYAEIRVLSNTILPEQAIVLSERSDKIFAGMKQRIVVSPLPSAEALFALQGSEVPVYFFHRRSNQVEDFPVVLQPYLHEMNPVLSYGNEGLYRLSFEREDYLEIKP